ncbi:MAG: hypothetical protein RIT10_1104 [Bacteroidota bacterium]|jgi:hypothetical protein
MIINQQRIVVIGGGSAGIAAGIAAAEVGFQVLLIEKSAYLGGKATASEVGTICGAYRYSSTIQADLILKGFAKDFVEELAIVSNSKPLSNQYGLHYLPYNIQQFKELSLKKLTEKGVEILLKTSVTNVFATNDQITAIELDQNGQKEMIEVAAVIDASGDALVSKLLQLPLIQSSNYQAAAQIFTLSDLPDFGENQLNLIFMKNIHAAVLQDEIPSYYKAFSVVQGSKTATRVKLKMTIPLEVNSIQNNLELLNLKGQEMARQFVQIQQSKSVSLQNIQLESIADEIGIRVLERPMGKYVLSEDDVLSGRKFDHAIATGAWPIEIWHPLKPLEMHYFKEDEWYQIPVESILSNEISNLYFAGRSISATDNAIASARVMGTCLQTGFAAGKIAVDVLKGLSIEESVSHIKKLQIID